jgi:hypothetical protein
VCAAFAISSVGLLAPTYAAPTEGEQAQAPVRPQTGTEIVTPAAVANAKNLTEEITTVGCIRAWKPAPEDVTKLPDNNRPGVRGVFLLTPRHASPNTVNDLPTYLLTPTPSVNFVQHLDDTVEVVGVAQTAPLPPTVQELATAPPRPENKPNAQSMPRLTVKSLRKVSDSCP